MLDAAEKVEKLGDLLCERLFGWVHDFREPAGVHGTANGA
ncbi:hypothetical protein GCM10009416_14290 [Craurococcus roseus]|uniref:Uncharacterized protein n=1 Tax=Craurococcus roseus TaxID=77585 RepID=A0ABP3Q0M3_9PROT